MIDQSLKFDRTPSVLVEVAANYSQVFARVKPADICEGGILMRTPDTIPQTTEVSLRFVLPLSPQGVEINAGGVVAQEVPDVGMAIVFMNLREDQRQAIARFVDEVSKSPAPTLEIRP